MDFRQNVSAIILNKNKILIIKKPNHESWAFPQGGIEKGETELEALKRELNEELRLINFIILKKSKYVHSYYWPKDLQIKKKYLGIKQRIYYLQTNQKIFVLNKRELENYKWVNRKELELFIKYSNIINFLDKSKKELDLILDCK